MGKGLDHHRHVSTGGTTAINYRLNDDKVVYEKRTSSSGTIEIYYAYDSQGKLYGFNLSSSSDSGWYVYKRNIQGDIIGIIDSVGNEVVSYRYDAWGNNLGITGTKASTVGVYNEYRYRGYRFDSDVGLYYLNSRYYDPNLCRFINADEPVTLAFSSGDTIGANLFAYCANNRVPSKGT